MAATVSRSFPRALPRALPTALVKPHRLQPLTQARMAASQTIATYDHSLSDRLAPQTRTLFDAKAAKNLTFADIGKALGRDEVAVAALFYGQHQTNDADISVLSKELDLDESDLKKQLQGFPFRGHVAEMPPKEPLIYRLYEIVQNYGYAYKAILNEKFGDGIMSAISFSTKVEKETDEKGEWVKITLRGKWLPYTRF